MGNASAQLSYRLPQGKNHAATVFVAVKHREVALSSRAQTLNPAAKGSDYRYSTLDIGGAVQWAINPTTSLQFQAQVGRRWYQTGTSGAQTFVIGVAQKLANTHVARLDMTTEFTQFSRDSRLNARRIEAIGTYAFPLLGGSMSGSLSLIELNAAGAGVAYRALAIGADLRPKPVIDGIDVDFSASAEARDYFKVPFSTPDIVLNAGAAATFNKASVFGFAPVVSLSAVRSSSEVVVRDTFDLGLSLGFSSAF